MFELGFAYGLAKPVIPVSAHPIARSELPFWLRTYQVGTYASQDGVSKILHSIATLLVDERLVQRPTPPRPIPNLAVWMGDTSWNGEALDRVRTALGREDLELEELDEQGGGPSIERAASAQLLVVTFDGTASDALLHYISGAVAAVPKVGFGPKSTPRVVLALVETDADKRYIAESLQRCHDVVTIVTPQSIMPRFEKFIEAYRKWVNQTS